MTDLSAKAVVQAIGESIVITATYPKAGTDRVDGLGLSLPRKPGLVDLANRLIKAIEAGVAYPDPEVAVDKTGRTYVKTRLNILGRTLNADLARLGY